MKKRVIIALSALVLIVLFAVFADRWLDENTQALCDLLRQTEQTEEDGKADVFEEYLDAYEQTRGLMACLVYKGKFEEIDILNGNLHDGLENVTDYDDLEPDLNRLEQLVRELYDRTSFRLSNIL